MIETRSFTKAADTLGMPRSSVSTAVADLEARLGTRLLHRTTRRVVPTDEGAELHERCLGFLTECEDIETMFRTAPAQVEGRIRVDMPGRIGRMLVAPALPVGGAVADALNNDRARAMEASASAQICDSDTGSNYGGEVHRQVTPISQAEPRWRIASPARASAPDAR